MTNNVSVYKDKFTEAMNLLNPLHARGDENARYYQGKNWTQKDIEAHARQGFYHAYSIPLTAVKLNRILSLQRANRFDAKARGRGEEDELTAEVINYIIKYTDDVNRFKYIESEIFQDGICKLFGILKVDIDYTIHPLGEITLTKVPYKQFYYDANSVLYNLDDATFMGQTKLIPKDKAEQLYKAFDFDRYGDDAPLPAYERIENMYDQAQYSNTFEGRATDWADEKNKLIRINEHFDLNYVTKHVAKNLKTGDYLEFDTKQEAQNYVKDMLMQLQMQTALGTPVDKKYTQEDFTTFTKKSKEWKRIVFTGEKIVEESVHPFKRPGLFRYAAFFDDGDIWSLTDLAKDTQKAYDRMMSMIDKSTAKNIKGSNYVILPDKLHPSENKNVDALFRRLSGGGSYVAAVSNDVIMPMAKINDVRVESGLAQGYQSIIEDLLGGRSFQGLDNKTRQTATEVLTVEKNATQSGLLFSDNLARWKQDVYSYLVEVIKYVYTPERTVRVIGEIENRKVLEALTTSGVYSASNMYEGEVGYFNLNKLQKPISDCELDIIIDNVESSKMDREEKFRQVMALNEIALRAGYQPLPFDLITKYSNLDPTIKTELMKYQEQERVAMQQKMEVQADIEKTKQLTQIANATKPDTPTNTSINAEDYPKRMRRVAEGVNNVAEEKPYL